MSEAFTALSPASASDERPRLDRGRGPVAVLAYAYDTGEAGYVGYEMKIRDWETRVGGIIGASGCLYAIRTRASLRACPLDAP